MQTTTDSQSTSHSICSSKVWSILVHAWDESPFYQTVFVASDTAASAAALAIEFVESQLNAELVSADEDTVREVCPPRSQRVPIADFWPHIYFASGRAFYQASTRKSKEYPAVTSAFSAVL
jgi:hypothetical protein